MTILIPHIKNLAYDYSACVRWDENISEPAYHFWLYDFGGLLPCKKYPVQKCDGDYTGTDKLWSQYLFPVSIG